MATVEVSAYADFIRPDGKEKVTGAGRYTADLTLTGMAHAAFRYSDHAHAKIRRLDTERARRLPGVVAVITQDDVPDVRFGGFVQDRTLFAKDVVRFEGEIVAAVAALTPEAAREAARRIEVEYEPLPIVNDFEAATEPGAPLVGGEAPPAPTAKPKPAAKPAAQQTAAATPAAAAPSKYVVQVGSKKNQTDALASFADMQQKYPSLLANYRPIVQKADLGAKGTWYRLRIGPIADKTAANKLCGQLKSQGLPDCLVMAQ